MEETKTYPATLDIDYSEQSNRLTVFFRLFTVIPIFIIWGLLFGGSSNSNTSEGATVLYYGVGLVVLPTVLMILFRQKYPRWWFDWNLAMAKFSVRVFAYFLMLRDEYPSTDEEQAVHLDIRYPDVKTELMRGMPLIKWLLAVPHYIVLAFLYVGVVFVSIIAWFAILITGSYPRGLFDYVVGVMRWELRVAAYALLMATDQYPPFSLSE